MDFKTELEELLRRYVPIFTEDKDQYENTIKLLYIKLEDLHEKYKED